VGSRISDGECRSQDSNFSRIRNALVVRFQVVEHLRCDLELKDPLGLAPWACFDRLVEFTVRVDPQWFGIGGKHVAQYLGEKKHTASEPEHAARHPDEASAHGTNRIT
jgi:hypothetical protein